ncbi:MAG: hypothetical protein R6V83_07020 [Candidatus Thorarchaeota archaeon]
MVWKVMAGAIWNLRFWRSKRMCLQRARGYIILGGGRIEENLVLAAEGRILAAVKLEQSVMMR